MTLLALILVPAAAALAAWWLSPAARSRLLLVAAAGHAALTALLWSRGSTVTLGGWLAADSLGMVVLTLVTVLFLAVSHYAVGYLAHPEARAGRAFVSCMLAFLAAATLVATSQHLALLWIGMETTTLAVAPLVLDRSDRRSLEAVWKYLVLSSVGVAFALLGVFLLATAQPSAGAGRPLIISDMMAHARKLDAAWLRMAFVFVAVGFGTKMGLAPMHSWKPDTYGQAPGLVAGLMAGALTSCAFLGLSRVSAIAFAAGQDAFVRPVLIVLGVVSLVIATAFIVGQRDVRRLLAYSSVEHMGLLALGIGIGGGAAYGSLLHVLNNGLIKGVTFLAVGNVVLAHGTSASSEVRGLLRTTPATGALLIIGLFAVTGAPPFGLFISEFAIVRGAFAENHPWIGGIVLLLLATIFVGIAAMILEMVYGEPDPAPVRAPRSGERTWFSVAPAALACLVLMLGLYIPAPLAEVLSRAAVLLGGHAP
ncbi:MAG TPA: proton-conducting transporter membrane subunit [Gemmatimonadales bacterium]|nr:proton-conducting transporter membrane subunit [Gemmatimonadales bacterium]